MHALAYNIDFTTIAAAASLLIRCCRKGLASSCADMLENVVSDLPCNIRREGGKSLVIGGSSLVLVTLEGNACNPL